ncbi:hypothetical protein [Nocardia jinanensis]|uniref:Uncharacterized protein n=1 Tax=Nocardia jinanensis TaxID=382504 RepID=A0A917VS96_9NOCA|nr:hypothetical protein [Nocardia jinanensis]GGL13598.1 hypothetical protein GCM10011588_30040 [Nocardia jinanensis]
MTGQIERTRALRLGRTDVSGLSRFPTTACLGTPYSCPQCQGCATDCANCEICLDGECERCAPPDLTPRTAGMLLISCQYLAAEVRASILRGTRPVFLYHLARTFDTLADSLSHGERPAPHTPAEQLCLHTAIDYARELACTYGEQHVEHLAISTYDYNFPRLFDTLLPDDEHEPLVELAQTGADGALPWNFAALGDLLTGNAMSTLFAPFEVGDRVA